MNSEIVERDGKLFILDPWQNHFSKPIKYRTTNITITGCSSKGLKASLTTIIKF